MFTTKNFKTLLVIFLGLISLQTRAQLSLSLNEIYKGAVSETSSKRGEQGFLVVGELVLNTLGKIGQYTGQVDENGRILNENLSTIGTVAALTGGFGVGFLASGIGYLGGAVEGLVYSGPKAVFNEYQRRNKPVDVEAGLSPANSSSATISGDVSHI